MTGRGDDRAATVEALLASGHVIEAAACFDAELLDATLSRASSARLRLRVATAQIMDGDAAAALAHTEALLGESGHDDEVYSAAERIRLIALMAHDEFANARAPAVAILAGATPDDDASMAAALTTMGSVAWTEGRVADSIMLLRAAVSRSRRGRFADRAMHPRQSLAVPLTAIGEFTEAEALLLEDAEDMRAEDDRAWAVGVAVRRSRVHFAAGDISAAISEAESALSLAEKVGARLFVPVARRTLAAAAVHRGDFETATVELERFREEPAAAKVRHEASADAWVQARISQVFEGSAAAAKVLAPVFENLAANKRLLLEEPALAGWMVRSLLAAGDRNRAESVVDAARQLATNNAAYPSIGASLLHARGLLHDDPSDLVQASSEYAHPWARACAADDAATALTADGQLARGSQLLDAAIALYRQAGADHDAERARRRSEQPRAGATDQSGPPPVSGWWSLTDTERGVSELVAMGLTNSEIAARLFLSRFTVDFHLRKIFRKLDVHTRVEVARLAVEHAPSADD